MTEMLHKVRATFKMKTSKYIYEVKMHNSFMNWARIKTITLFLWEIRLTPYLRKLSRGRLPQPGRTQTEPTVGWGETMFWEHPDQISWELNSSRSFCKWTACRTCRAWKIIKVMVHYVMMSAKCAEPGLT